MRIVWISIYRPYLVAAFIFGTCSLLIFAVIVKSIGFFLFIPVNCIHVFTLQVFLVYIQDVRCSVLGVGCQYSQSQKRTKVDGGRSLTVTPPLQNLPTPSPGLLHTCHLHDYLRCQRFFLWVNPVVASGYFHLRGCQPLT